TSAFADDRHAGGAHRLARSIHRARRSPNPPQETRHHCRRIGGKGASALAQKIQAQAIGGLKSLGALARSGWVAHASRGLAKPSRVCELFFLSQLERSLLQ